MGYFYNTVIVEEGLCSVLSNAGLSNSRRWRYSEAEMATDNDEMSNARAVQDN